MPHGFLVHFPVALLMVSFVFDLLAKVTGREGLRHAGFYALAGGVVGAAGAVATGFLAADALVTRVMDRMGPEGAGPVLAVVATHRALALGTLAVSLLLLVWRINVRNELAGSRYSAYLAAALVVALLVGGTGYVGGEQIRRSMFRAAGGPGGFGGPGDSGGPGGFGGMGGPVRQDGFAPGGPGGAGFRNGGTAGTAGGSFGDERR